MEKIVCARCGHIIEEKKYMIQVVEYLGKFGNNFDLCT